MVPAPESRVRLTGPFSCSCPGLRVCHRARKWHGQCWRRGLSSGLFGRFPLFFCREPSSEEGPIAGMMVAAWSHGFFAIAGKPSAPHSRPIRRASEC